MNLLKRAHEITEHDVLTMADWRWAMYTKKLWEPLTLVEILWTDEQTIKTWAKAYYGAGGEVTKAKYPISYDTWAKFGR